MTGPDEDTDDIVAGDVVGGVVGEGVVAEGAGTEAGTVTTDGGGGRRRASPLTISLVLATAIVVLDQITKHWAVNALNDGRSRHVIWTLDWNLTYNSGMAFSRAQGIGPYIGAVALIVIVVMLLSIRRADGLLSTIAVGMVVGGAIGNIGDRLFREDGWLRGRVVDFIDFNWWPIFNIADVGITVGGVLLVLTAFFQSRTTPS